MGLPTHICNSKEGYVMVLFMCGFLNFDTELNMQCMQYTYTLSYQINVQYQISIQGRIFCHPVRNFTNKKWPKSKNLSNKLVQGGFLRQNK